MAVQSAMTDWAVSHLELGLVPRTSLVSAAWTLVAMLVGAGLWLFWNARVVRGDARRRSLSRSQRLALGFGAFIGGMLGAKLPFALAKPEGWLTGWAWLESGKTLMFGLVGGYVGVEFAKWVTAVKFKTGDRFVVPVAAAVAVGRMSCYSAGCCAGRPTNLPWGVDFGDAIRRHPTQIYELIFHAAVAGGAAWMYRRGWFRDQLIKLYFITYFLFRFLTEFLRPEPAIGLGLTAYQWASLVLTGCFILLFAQDRSRLQSRSCSSGSISSGN